MATTNFGQVLVVDHSHVSLSLMSSFVITSNGHSFFAQRASPIKSAFSPMSAGSEVAHSAFAARIVVENNLLRIDGIGVLFMKNMLFVSESEPLWGRQAKDF